MTDATNPPVERKKGRSPYTPTSDQRAQVARLIASRTTHEMIAAEIGCSVPTLRKHFAGELASTLSADNLFTAGPVETPPLHQAPARRRATRAGGRPRRDPTMTERAHVSELIATGIPVVQIAVILKASEPWVRKAFAAEIASGAVAKRAEVIRMMFRTANKGNVTAQRALIDMMDRAELERVEAKLSGKDIAAPQRVEVIGKKAEAEIAAHGVVSGSGWSDLLSVPAQKH